MTTFAQRSFARGEITPALYARTDMSAYATGLRTCRNHMILRHGGATSRPGTQFIAAANSVVPVRLIPFIYNPSQSYVLEFGAGYMRVYKSGIQVTDVTKTISGATNANPCVLTVTGHGFSNGDEVQISGISGAMGIYLNNRNFKIANVTTNTFSLVYLTGGNVDSTLFGPYVSGGTAGHVYQIATAYQAADLSTLKFTQSAAVMTIAHPNYPPSTLTRNSDTFWAITPITFAPSITSPTSITVTITGPYPSGQSGYGGLFTFAYAVTAVSATGEESIVPSSGTGFSNSILPSTTNPVNITITAVSGAVSYNVYKSIGGGVYGLIGVADGGSSPTFTDVGGTIDASTTAPQQNNPFPSSQNYPAAVGYFQDRLCFGGTNNAPETMWCSRSGYYYNFSTSTPIQEDDAIEFTLVGRQVNQIQAIVDLGQMIVFTSNGEWAMQGDQSGTITPTEINPKQYSYNGSASLQPLVIDYVILYVQARGSFIRNLFFDFVIDGYRGDDITIFSQHLFEGYTLNDWAYSKIPNSIVWAARSDGALLGLTYVREQEMLAWHRHDFQGGYVENVCVVPEGNEDVLYLTITRYINGNFVRYIERMNTRFFTDVIDFVGMDASLSYDGRNTDPSSTLTLTGGFNWVYTETLLLTATGFTGAAFSAGDVGSAVFLNVLDDDGNVAEQIRCTIVGYTSSTQVTVRPNRTVPISLRNIATWTWALAVSQVGGLWHLEGQEVAVFADRFVVGSPNNPDYTVYTVANGTLQLDQPYSVIHVGLPITADFETLDIDTPGQLSIADKNKLMTCVTAYVQNSRGIWAGGENPDDNIENTNSEPLYGLTELKIREHENYDDPVGLATKPVEINIEPHWNSNGRVFIRQVDPVPLTILAVMPSGLVPIGQGR